MSARTLSLGLLAAALTALAGCPPCNPPFAGAAQRWNFEDTLCGGQGPLCGFEAQAGSAQIVAAFTPGEHAMQIASESRMAAAVTAPLETGGGTPLTSTISLLARCDPGTTLEVGVTISETFASSDGGVAVPALATPTATLIPGSDWGQASTTMNPSVGLTHAPSSATVVLVTLATHGPGTCTVDDIALMNRAFLCE